MLMRKRARVKALGVQVKSTCRRIDPNIRRRVPTTREAIIKITTIRKVKDKKVVIKKEGANPTIKNMEWENLKELLISQTSSLINKTCSRWTNLKFKSYLLMYSLCMAMILLPLVELKIKVDLKTQQTQSMVYNR